MNANILLCILCLACCNIGKCDITLKPKIHCDGTKIESYTYGQYYGSSLSNNDCDKYKSLITSILNKEYKQSILEKMQVDEIIITGTIGSFKSRRNLLIGISFENFVAISTIDSRDSFLFVRTFYHEMMHHIFASGLNKLIDEDKMTFDAKYIGRRYDEHDRHSDFVSQYARFDVEEDICETYAYMMTASTIDMTPKIIITNTLLKKTCIIYHALRIYDYGFTEILGKFYTKHFVKKNICDFIDY